MGAQDCCLSLNKHDLNAADKQDHYILKTNGTRIPGSYVVKHSSWGKLLTPSGSPSEADPRTIKGCQLTQVKIWNNDLSAVISRDYSSNGNVVQPLTPLSQVQFPSELIFPL